MSFYNQKIWKEVLEGYGFVRMEHKGYCCVCMDDTKQIVYTDAPAPTSTKLEVYRRQAEKQELNAMCKHHVYYLYHEGVIA